MKMSSDVIEISSDDEASGIKASESGVVETTNKLDQDIAISEEEWEHSPKDDAQNDPHHLEHEMYCESMRLQARTTRVLERTGIIWIHKERDDPLRNHLRDLYLAPDNQASESGVVESTNKLDKKIPIWKVDARNDPYRMEHEYLRDLYLAPDNQQSISIMPSK